MNVYDELTRRGLIAQVTNKEEISSLVNAGKAVFYIGFDPTADSLHVGHFMALSLMKRLQMAGNKPVALIGDGTAMVGDPSGRTDLRKMMTIETIDHNAECFKKQMSRFIDFGEGKAMMLRNSEWLRPLNYLEFLRDVGPHFSVNRMLAAECYKRRMEQEQGLTFLEFNYMLMQAYDFYYLNKKYGCNLQFGGDDQWSNMLAGTELIRRKDGKDAHAMTITLLLNSQGNKMGKTAAGAVWLDADKTSPYDFYQYWRNVDDSDVIKCLNLLTFVPVEEIDELAKLKGQEINKAKEKLAYELTALVHGTDEAKKAEDGAKNIFAGGGNTENMPVLNLSKADFDAGRDGRLDICDLLVKSGFDKSKGDARRDIEGGGVTFDSNKVTDPKLSFEPNDFKEEKVLQKGKKNFIKIIFSSLALFLTLSCLLKVNVAYASSIVTSDDMTAVSGGKLKQSTGRSNVIDGQVDVITEGNTGNITSNVSQADLEAINAVRITLNGDYLNSNTIINPKTGSNVNGCIIKNNPNFSITIANPNVIANAYKVEQYYYETIGAETVMIRTQEGLMARGEIGQVIPRHTYNDISSEDNSQKLFVTKITVLNEDDTLVGGKEYYFQLVSEEDYEAYEEYLKLMSSR